jgi:hypothetical protein
MSTLRVGGVAGLGFVLAFFGALVLTDVPDASNTTAEALRFYAEDGNRVKTILAGYLFGVAGLCFVGFLVALVGVLRAAGPRSLLPNAVLVSGSVYLALSLAAGAAFVAPAATLALDPEHSGNATADLADFARGLAILGDWLLLMFGPFAAAALVAGTSLAALRTGALRPWLAWGGLGIATTLLAGVLFFPLFVFLLWALAVSVSLLRVPESTDGARPDRRAPSVSRAPG